MEKILTLDEAKKCIAKLEMSNSTSAIIYGIFDEESLNLLKKEGYFSQTYKNYTCFYKDVMQLLLPQEFKDEIFKLEIKQSIKNVANKIANM